MADSRPRRPRVRVLIGAATALGPGKADLLQAIAETGSIAAAARRMNMSYRRAWLLVDAINASFREPLVETETGGRGGGGARVGALGLDVLRRYRVIEAKAEAAVADEIAAFADLVVDPEEPE